MSTPTTQLPTLNVKVFSPLQVLQALKDGGEEVCDKECESVLDGYCKFRNFVDNKWCFFVGIEDFMNGGYFICKVYIRINEEGEVKGHFGDIVCEGVDEENMDGVWENLE